MAEKLMQVTEEASITIEEDGVEYEPVFLEDGITPVLDEKTGEQKRIPHKVRVRVPVALHKGKTYPATHAYPKGWPHLFEPFAPKVEQ